MDKNLLNGAKTKTNFCATLPSNTNKSTKQHGQTQLSTQKPTQYITYTTKLIILSWVKIKYKARQMHDHTQAQKPIVITELL